jgi:hypothetical protein
MASAVSLVSGQQINRCLMPLGVAGFEIDDWLKFVWALALHALLTAHSI